MTSRREFLGFVAAGTSLALLPQAWAADGTPIRGGQLVVNLQPEPQGLVAGIAVSAPAVVVSSSLFDGLVGYDQDFKPVPQLATAWQQSPDGRTITFQLRRDVTWHDGKPFTSADVQYSIMELAKKVHPRGGATFAAVTAVETPDPHTAVLQLSAPAPVIWSALAGTETQIIPRHIYEGTDILTNPNNGRPIGNGAFIFKEWVKGSHITLERNPNYWNKDKPYLDRVTFRFIPDAGARAAALEAGEVQYTPLSPVPLSDVERLRNHPALVVEKRGWEGSAPMFFFDFNLRRKEFQDVRVRRAIAHAIDRQALARTVWYGLAEPATGPVPSYQKQFYTPDVPHYAYDLKKAEALLDEAGLKRGSDGVRLRFNHLPMPYGDDYRRSGEFIRQSLKRIGVEVELVNYDVPTFLRKVFTDRDFDTLNSFYAAFADPQIGVQRRYWSKAIKSGTPWGNGSGYSDAETDAIIEAIQAEVDTDKRRQLIHQLQVRAQSELPTITLLELQFFRVYARRLRGVSTVPDGSYQSMGDLWLTS